MSTNIYKGESGKKRPGSSYERGKLSSREKKSPLSSSKEGGNKLNAKNPSCLPRPEKMGTRAASQ